jgi:hypothetical protein
MTGERGRNVAIVLAGGLVFLTLHLIFILTWDRFFTTSSWPGYEASANGGLIEPWFVNTPASLWFTRATLFVMAFSITLFAGARPGSAALAFFTGAAAGCAAMWATTRAHAVEWGWLGFIIYPLRLLLPVVIGAVLAAIIRSRRTRTLPAN